MEWANLGIGATALLVSVAGFTVAIVQIRRARSAAEAASRAATEARDSLVHRLSIGDLARVSSEIDRLKELHRNQQWQRALDQHPRVRQTLVEVRSRIHDQPAETVTAFQEAIAQLAEMESAVERALADPSQSPTSLALNPTLVSIQQTLDDLRGRLEDTSRKVETSP